VASCYDELPCHNGILTTAPGSSCYEQLPHFDDATAKFYSCPGSEREKLLAELRCLVERFGLEDVVAVDLKHKHFRMPPGHVLYEEPDVDSMESLMKPVPMELKMVPFSFAFVNGCWRPYEFVGPGCVAVVSGLEKVCECSGFLEGLFPIIAKHGMEDVFGFHVLHRDHLGTGAHGTIEMSGEGDNELLLRPYTEELYRQMQVEGGSFQVMWSWRKSCNQGSGTCVFHCRHCGRHCNAHQR